MKAATEGQNYTSPLQEVPRGITVPGGKNGTANFKTGGEENELFSRNNVSVGKDGKESPRRWI